MATLEGGETVPTAIFVIEFPSMKQALAFYRDPDYAPMIALRQSCADSDIVLVQGLQSSSEPGRCDDDAIGGGLPNKALQRNG